VRAILCTALALLASAACKSTEVPQIPSLAVAQVANDFGSYSIKRIGLMPFAGEDISFEQRQALEAGFVSEISQATAYEVVILGARDLEEVNLSEPYRRGWYRPETIIDITRRYSLDGILFGTVIQQRFYPPQRLDLQMDLVVAETGMVVWSSSVHVDAADTRVLDGLKTYYALEDEEREWELALLSPARFARFAAYQVACGL